MGTQAISLSKEQLVQDFGKNFSRQKFYRQDFSGMKLAHADFRLATLIECDFTDADLKYANFESANCYGSNFTQTNLHRANMRDCSLEKTKFFPRDAFGLTVTLRCETFSGMECDPTWLQVWMFIPSVMDLTEEARDKIIEFIGPERYVKYKAIFSRRVF